MANNPDFYYKKHLKEVEKIGAAHSKQSEFKLLEIDKQKDHLREMYKVVGYQDYINRKNIKYILAPNDPKIRKERYKEAIRVKLLDPTILFGFINKHRYLFYNENG